jgi:hypothetical protein
MNVDYLLENVQGLTVKNIKCLESPGVYTSAPKVNDLEDLYAIIVENFSVGTFKNKDLSAYVTFLTSRQIPSRLKKLVESGILTDQGGTPKSYSIS